MYKSAFVKTVGKPAAGMLMFLYLSVFQVKAQKVDRPNIIVFLVDDMGWQDTSLPFWSEATAFNKMYHTPNMEKLARQGLKFTSAYAAPVCTPSRAAMLSGMNPAHSRITNWTSTDKNTNTDAGDAQFKPTGWNINGLSPVPGIANTCVATPFPQLLKEAGYFTIHVGKAHWGSSGTPGSNPYNMGFMVNISGNAAGNPQSYLPQENYGNQPGRATARAVPDMQEYYGSQTFLTEAVTREALKAMEEPVRRGTPFYLNMAHYALHVPIQADPRFIKRYTDAGLPPTQAAYASLIEGMDKSLGDIMHFLDEKGIAKNTVLIFMSDNGGLSQAAERGGLDNTQNLPLKAGKGSVYEGGIREPMIVRYPRWVKPGTVTDQYVIIEDFFPSILELAGIRKFKTRQTIDGQSFVPLLRNPASRDNSRALIWHYPNKWSNARELGINYFSAIRVGDWKLVYSQRSGKTELYNLKVDIGELNDLSAVNPAKAGELRRLLGAKLKAWKADMPVRKSDGKPLPYPGDPQPL